jgi:hypothetical protein
MRGPRSPLLQLMALALVFALLGMVIDIGRGIDELGRNALATFFVHVLGPVAGAGVVLGGVLIYRRVARARLVRRLLARIGRGPS